METRQNTNDFSKGMANIPSDAVCPDDSVAAEWNMIYRNGEHHPIQAPEIVNIFPNLYKTFHILYIHRVYSNDATNNKHYIGVSAEGQLIFSIQGGVSTQIGSQSDYTVENINGITSIGNTLVVNKKNEGLRYFLWKPDETKYTFIGNRIPQPNVKFCLESVGPGEVFQSSSYWEKASGDYSGILSLYTTNDTYAFNAQDSKKADADAYIVGLYESAKSKVTKKKGFCNPFFIRYALKLFDGSYTNISTPILMFPSVRNNLIFYKGDDVNFNSGNFSTAYVIYCKLYYLNKVKYTEWSDIVKNVTVFITNPVDVVDTESGLGKYVTLQSEFLPDYFDTISKSWRVLNESEAIHEYTTIKKYNENYIANAYVKKSDSDILKELTTSSVFYKLFDINPMEKNLVFQASDSLFRWQDLENLTTSEQLDHDDYYSNCPLSADHIYMYNKRLHLSNIQRGFYKGSTVFMPLKRDSSDDDVTTYVHISTSDGERIIKNTYKTTDVLGYYYYYPDPRANMVNIYIGTTHFADLPLKPHPLLNGAYYIQNTLPTASTSAEEADMSGAKAPEEKTELEHLSNEVWVSEVNNPFVFNASGVNSVGNGSIINIVSNTTAISQGQFGQFPLICFTTDGVWVLQTSTEGIYSSAHPISREVCNNAKSVVTTDKLVFFSSEKGLMMINGPEVRCVSEQLSGKTYVPSQQEISLYNNSFIEQDVNLIDYLREARIAYDYRDQLLWIVNGNYNQCFVMSIESGVFAMSTLPYKICEVVNDYPDNILLGSFDNGEGAQYFPYSFMERPNINDDGKRISSFIISRPIKVGDQNALKCPTMARFIGNLNPQAEVRLRLFASDDMVNWAKVISLRGRGFKYFKYNIIFDRLLPTDTFSGIAERWQFKYLSKFR